MQKIEIGEDGREGAVYTESLKDYLVLDTVDKCEKVLGFVRGRLEANLWCLLDLLYALSIGNSKGFGLPLYVLLNAFKYTKDKPLPSYEVHAYIGFLKAVNFIQVVKARNKSTNEVETFLKVNHEVVGKWAHEKMVKLTGDERYQSMIEGLAKSAKEGADLLDHYERIN